MTTHVAGRGLSTMATHVAGWGLVTMAVTIVVTSAFVIMIANGHNHNELCIVLRLY